MIVVLNSFKYDTPADSVVVLHVSLFRVSQARIQDSRGGSTLPLD